MHASRPLPRQSMYPAPPQPSHWSALEACSAALAQSCFHVQRAVEVLHQGTEDLPRLAAVVQNRRMFDLVLEPDVASAQRALGDEMRPQIEELISRAEGGLERLKERERELRGKLDKRASHPSTRSAPVSVPQSDLDALELRLAQLRRQKEREAREVEMLDEEIERRRAKGRAGR
ncbi:hypothetical protein JCM10207_004835 [Rhodosporidiobolus poonsookiae]